MERQKRYNFYPEDKIREIAKKGEELLSPFAVLAEFGQEIPKEDKEVCLSIWATQIAFTQTDAGPRLKAKDTGLFLRAAVDTAWQYYDVLPPESQAAFWQAWQVWQAVYPKA